MKTMKKLLALTMVIAMVMAMAVTAGAATITIQNSLPGTTYKFYQLMTYVTDTGSGSGTGWYKVVPGLETILAPYFEIREDGYVVGKKAIDGVIPSDTALANMLINVFKDKTAKYTCTTDENGTYTFSDGVEKGYYLMTSTKTGDTNPRVNASLTLFTNDTLVIREKNSENDLPKVDKTMTGEGDQYFVGDTRTFKVEVTMDEGDNKYTVTDVMEGLQLVAGSVQVTTKPAHTKTPVITPTADGFTVVIEFEEGYTSHANEKIIIEYSATVLESAYDFIKNTVTVDGSYNGDSEKDDDEVTEKQYDFTVKKVDSADTSKQLEGAEFLLKNGEGKYAVFTADAATADPNDMILTGWTQHYEGDTCAADAHTAETVLATKIVLGSKLLKGLADGDYYLVETKAPVGYQAITGERSVAITVTEGGYTVYGGDENHVVAIANTKLDKLPETGGMGTTMFYTMGGFMVLAAAVLLVTKKRVSA